MCIQRATGTYYTGVKHDKFLSSIDICYVMLSLCLFYYFLNDVYFQATKFVLVFFEKSKQYSVLPSEVALSSLDNVEEGDYINVMWNEGETTKIESCTFISISEDKPYLVSRMKEKIILLQQTEPRGPSKRPITRTKHYGYDPSSADDSDVHDGELLVQAPKKNASLNVQCLKLSRGLCNHQ